MTCRQADMHDSLQQHKHERNGGMITVAGPKTIKKLKSLCTIFRRMGHWMAAIFHNLHWTILVQ